MTGLRRPLRDRRGFTLVELVVVLVILGITASFAVPALTGYIDTSKEKKAVSEAQACVMAATRLGAAQYAKVQQRNVNVPLNSGAGAAKDDSLDSWAPVDGQSAPEITGGDVALTEGSGQYLLHVTDAPAGSFPGDVSAFTTAAEVDGSVKTLTFNSNGQLLYLVYTSTDGIQVVYTNSGSKASVKNDDDFVVVPTPKATDAPTPTVTPRPTVEPTAEPTATPASKTIEINFVKKDSYTDKYLDGAQLQIVNTITRAVVDSWQTDKNHAHKCKLPAGSYRLDEISAPQYYEKASSISFSIVTSGKNGKDLSLNCASPYKTADREITMVDNIKTTNLVFWAADEAHNDLSGIPLPLTGDNLGSRDLTETQWVSDKSQGHKLEVPLKPGTYTFSVNSSSKLPSEYYVPLWVKITVDEKGTAVVTDHSNGADKRDTDLDGDAYIDDNGIHLICKTKRYSLNSVLIYKRDTNSKPLAGATFTITDVTTSVPTVVATVTSGKNATNSITQSLSSDKYVHYNNIYCLHETEAPDGYLTASDVFFTLKMENDKTVLYSSVSKNGPFSKASDNTIIVVDEKDDGFKIIAKDDTTASFTPIPWPTEGLISAYVPEKYKNCFVDANGNIVDQVAPVKKGTVYYHDVDGVRRYFVAITDVPNIDAYTWNITAPESCSYTTEINSDYILTRNDTDRIVLKSTNPDAYYVKHVTSGELILYKGNLYIAKFSNDYFATYPPADEVSNWIFVDPTYFKITQYTKGADPDGEDAGLYSEFLNK